MSHSSGLVKFKNGEILHYEYNGTVDVCISHLYQTLDELWKYWRKSEWLNCTCGRDEWVQIYSSYGGGFYWTGRACKSCMAMTKYLSPFDDDHLTTHHDGEPRWATKYYKGRETK